MSIIETTIHSKHSVKKVNEYRSKYGLQHGTLACIEQPAINDPKNHSGKTIKTGKLKIEHAQYI